MGWRKACAILTLDSLFQWRKQKDAAMGMCQERQVLMVLGADPAGSSCCSALFLLRLPADPSRNQAGHRAAQHIQSHTGSTEESATSVTSG